MLESISHFAKIGIRRHLRLATACEVCRSIEKIGVAQRAKDQANRDIRD